MSPTDLKHVAVIGDPYSVQQFVDIMSADKPSDAGSSQMPQKIIPCVAPTTDAQLLSTEDRIKRDIDHITSWYEKLRHHGGLSAVILFGDGGYGRSSDEAVKIAKFVKAYDPAIHVFVKTYWQNDPIIIGAPKGTFDRVISTFHRVPEVICEALGIGTGIAEKIAVRPGYLPSAIRGHDR